MNALKAEAAKTQNDLQVALALEEVEKGSKKRKVYCPSNRRNDLEG
jgi:glycerol-3-phosphate cytidylyltransferase-like family protein